MVLTQCDLRAVLWMSKFLRLTVFLFSCAPVLSCAVLSCAVPRRAVAVPAPAPAPAPVRLLVLCIIVTFRLSVRVSFPVCCGR